MPSSESSGEKSFPFLLSLWHRGNHLPGIRWGSKSSSWHLPCHLSGVEEDAKAVLGGLELSRP